MAEEEKSGMMDLEKELSCSICTDVLYQPLTLLDCLHTFCGACLKEWFHFQASSATSIHPYTCPSCRASVRDTRHNASVTTLLDMYLQAHPDRGKSQQDKDDQDKKYKPGENVLPKLRKREDPGADEERRLIAEAQQLSLREAGFSSGGLEAPRERRRRERSRERSRDSRDPDGRRPRTRDSSRNPPEPPRSSHVPARHVEHQSSLRSLLSASDLDSQEMEEEIMRQIMEEGLLDGIDLANIDVAQEDEISERIAQAYRRRQRERQQQRTEREDRQTGEGRVETALPSPPATLPSPASRDSRSSSRASAPQPIRVDGDQARRRPHGRSESAVLALPSPNSSRPPVSRPGLIDAANNNGRAHHRRSSSQGSTRSAPRVDALNSLSVTSSSQAARSAGELNAPPPPSVASSIRRRRLSQNDRSTTDPEARQFRSSLNTHTSSSNPNSPRRSAFNVNTESPLSSLPPSALMNPSPNSSSRRTTDPTHARPSQPTINSSPAFGVPRATTEPSAADSRPATSTGATTAPAAPPTLFSEPNIICNRCGKTHIEYDLHYNCALCDNGNYNICLDCYRLSKGCKHWFGFGYAAWRNYEQKAPPGGHPANNEQPHVLVGHRYKRPSNLPAEPRPTTTDQDPARRLESGVFCDMCSAFASSCYWKCDICNEGGWGFCNDCVNQGRHCTHPLLPLSHNPTPKPASITTSAPSTPSLQPPPTPSTPPLTPKSASLIRGPGTTPLANQLYRPLTFSTCCDICTYPIPPSHTRFHCPRCTGGDYDICTPCYHGLVSAGRISAENGHQGWRRCLRGHRMVVVGFEDRDGGQRRVVSRDLVGGLALRDEDGLDSQAVRTRGANADVGETPNWSWKDVDGTVRKSRGGGGGGGGGGSKLGLGTPGRFPPDGGVGMRVVALWARFPREGVVDELMFPKFAEVREAEDINGDWFWGCYAGAKGLFPGNWTKPV